MPANPYESPKTELGCSGSPSSDRSSALRSVRLACLILLVPALFNYHAFDTRFVEVGRIAPVVVVYRTLNLLGIAISYSLVWFFALPVLELVARTLHKLFARHVSQDRWLAVLYTSLNLAAYYAVPGAILWVVWVIGLYYLDVGFVAISYGIGVPAHILAACLYVPLLVRWYNLARSDSSAPRHRTAG